MAFLSARYGFRVASTEIADYDARLTRDLADAMIAGWMTTRWPRPRLPSIPDNAGVHPGVEIAGLRGAAREPLRDVALVGGALYLEVMRAFLAGFREMGCLAPDAAVTEINGPIGFMRRDLRAWLAISQPGRPSGSIDDRSPIGRSRHPRPNPPIPNGRLRLAMQSRPERRCRASERTGRPTAKSAACSATKDLILQAGAAELPEWTQRRAGRRLVVRSDDPAFVAKDHAHPLSPFL